MWKHLNDTKGHENHPNKLPKGRYYKIVVWIACHGFLDVIAFSVYCAAYLSPSISVSEKFFLQNMSSIVGSYHVACFPIVYCGIRDLKFHDQLKLRSMATTRRNMKSMVDGLAPTSPTSPIRILGQSFGDDGPISPNSEKKLGHSTERIQTNENLEKPTEDVEGLPGYVDTPTEDIRKSTETIKKSMETIKKSTEELPSQANIYHLE